MNLSLKSIMFAVLVCLTVSCTSDKKAIEDYNKKLDRVEAKYGKCSSTEEYKALLKELKKVDYSECPEDYRIAVANSFSKADKLVRAVEDSGSLNAYVDSFLAGLTLNLDSYDKYGNAVRDAKEELIDSVAEVEKLEAKYNVKKSD